MTQKIEPKLIDQLERLFVRESFGIEVILRRAKIGIPIMDGFASNDKYLGWLKKHRDRFYDIQSARAELARAFKLPLPYSQWIEGYLLLGKKFKDFNTIIPFGMSFSRGWDNTGFSCAFEFDKDGECVNIKILPGASYRDVSKFIKKNKIEIEKLLKSFERRVKPIRVRNKQERDELIYVCFKKGWLTRYGLVGEAVDISLVPEEVRQIDLDYRRKIIGEQLKMRK